MDRNEIVFVCTANMCRSPMAEYLFKARLDGSDPWEACSAGVMAMDGAPASAAAIEVMNEKGIDISSHRSRQLTRHQAEDALLIVVMTAAHRTQIAAQFRDTAILDKVFLLKAFGPRGRDEDVHDPIGASSGFYREIRDEIDEAMPGLIKYLKNRAPDTHHP